MLDANQGHPPLSPCISISYDVVLGHEIDENGWFGIPRMRIAGSGKHKAANVAFGRRWFGE
jgi:hypothetical protein